MMEPNIAEENVNNLQQESINVEDPENVESELSETDIEGVEGGGIRLAGMHTY